MKGETMALEVTVRTIKNRWTDAVLWEGAAPSLRAAVEQAVLGGANLGGANLCGANLGGANLHGANLGGANLHGANLGGADLHGANLCGADLCGANLHGANLCGADLGGANLHGANLCGADLGGANLHGANLGGADLCGANLHGANLGGANLTPVRDDVWAVLSAAPAEAPALLTALQEGRIDGSCYEGTCACLVGTIANARGCAYTDLAPVLEANSGRPAEVFFAAIHPGDTPATSQPSAIAAGWVEEWLSRMRNCFSGAPAS
jgi:hypothetical protein